MNTQAEVFQKMLISPAEGDRYDFRLQRGATGLWFLTCNQIPGFLDADKDLNKIFSRAIPVLKSMHRAVLEPDVVEGAKP